MTADPLFGRALEALASARISSSDFDLNPAFKLPKAATLREAGVLVLLGECEGAWRVCLTKRSSALKHHPGQVAFPGGKQDEADADIIATALREAQEEIGLPSDAVEIVGQLPCHVTVTQFNVTPVVAVLKKPFPEKRDPNEVEEVFWTPLSHVLDPLRFSIQSRRWQGRLRSYYAVPFGPYYIWGATARMLRGWAEVVQ